MPFAAVYTLRTRSTRVRCAFGLYAHVLHRLRLHAYARLHHGYTALHIPPLPLPCRLRLFPALTRLPRSRLRTRTRYTRTPCLVAWLRRYCGWLCIPVVARYVCGLYLYRFYHALPVGYAFRLVPPTRGYRLRLRLRAGYHITHYPLRLLRLPRLPPFWITCYFTWLPTHYCTFLQFTFTFTGYWLYGYTLTLLRLRCRTARGSLPPLRYGSIHVYPLLVRYTLVVIHGYTVTFFTLRYAVICTFAVRLRIHTPFVWCSCYSLHTLHRFAALPRTRLVRGCYTFVLRPAVCGYGYGSSPSPVPPRCHTTFTRSLPVTVGCRFARLPYRCLHVLLRFTCGYRSGYGSACVRDTFTVAAGLPAVVPARLFTHVWITRGCTFLHTLRLRCAFVDSAHAFTHTFAGSLRAVTYIQHTLPTHYTLRFSLGSLRFCRCRFLDLVGFARTARLPAFHYICLPPRITTRLPLRLRIRIHVLPFTLPFYVRLLPRTPFTHALVTYSLHVLVAVHGYRCLRARSARCVCGCCHALRLVTHTFTHCLRSYGYGLFWFCLHSCRIPFVWLPYWLRSYTLRYSSPPVGYRTVATCRFIHTTPVTTVWLRLFVRLPPFSLPVGYHLPFLVYGYVTTFGYTRTFCGSGYGSLRLVTVAVPLPWLHTVPVAWFPFTTVPSFAYALPLRFTAGLRLVTRCFTFCVPHTPLRVYVRFLRLPFATHTRFFLRFAGSLVLHCCLLVVPAVAVRSHSSDTLYYLRLLQPRFACSCSMPYTHSGWFCLGSLRSCGSRLDYLPAIHLPFVTAHAHTPACRYGLPHTTQFYGYLVTVYYRVTLVRVRGLRTGSLRTRSTHTRLPPLHAFTRVYRISYRLPLPFTLVSSRCLPFCLAVGHAAHTHSAVARGLPYGLIYRAFTGYAAGYATRVAVYARFCHRIYAARTLLPVRWLRCLPLPSCYYGCRLHGWLVVLPAHTGYRRWFYTRYPVYLLPRYVCRLPVTLLVLQLPVYPFWLCSSLYVRLRCWLLVRLVGLLRFCVWLRLRLRYGYTHPLQFALAVGSAVLDYRIRSRSVVLYPTLRSAATTRSQRPYARALPVCGYLRSVVTTVAFFTCTTRPRTVHTYTPPRLQVYALHAFIHAVTHRTVTHRLFWFLFWITVWLHTHWFDRRTLHAFGFHTYVTPHR